MSKCRIFFISLFLFFILTAFINKFVLSNNRVYIDKNHIIKKYRNLKPKKFFAFMPGIKTRIKSKEKIIALTFDACGGRKGNGFDKRLIKYLVSNKIPATLFLSGLWIKANHHHVIILKNNSDFDIENHGLNHKPCSVCGFSIYGRKGTSNIYEAIREIDANALIIEKVVGRRPLFYRAGTAYFDDVAVKITHALGFIPLNYSGYTGDAEEKISTSRIVRNILKSTKNGTIFLFHMNRPHGNTYKAIKIIIPLLKKRGFKFVKVRDYVKDLI